MHVIANLRMETRAAGGALARKVDRRVADGMEELVELLGEGFDKVAGSRALRIDRLEVDLGTLAWADFERGFARRVAAAVMAKLGAADTEPAGKPDRSPAGGRLEAWVYFLRHGHLPWWFPESRRAEIFAIGEIHAADPERTIGELETLVDCPAALVRLARQATAEELAAALGLDRPAAEIGSPMNAIALWLGGLAGGAEALARVVPLLSRTEREALAGVLSLSPLTEHEPLGGALSRLAEADGMTAEERRAVAVSRDEPDPAAADGVFRERENGRSQEFPDAGLPVGTAGLVLLHPFLSRLFRQLGWLDEAGGLGPDFRWQAVQALQFLALGRCGLPEPTLVFEKTLCGIELWEPAEFPALDDAARQECDDLLAAVIGHWSVLGKTSIGGLRESFLVRPGSLRFEDGQVRLAVEKRPFDMLLGKLPWPLGPVMFKWLKRPIHVRWGENGP